MTDPESRDNSAGSAASDDLRGRLDDMIGSLAKLADTRLTPAQRDLLSDARESGEHVRAALNGGADLTRPDLNRPDLTRPDLTPPDQGRLPPEPSLAGGQLHRSDGRAPRILVVDDNPTNLAVISRMLERQGGLVDCIGDGVEAVQACLEHAFDAILMDITMPECDGVEATRRVRRSTGPNRDTPVMAMTANPLPSDVDRYRSAGIHDLIAKPIRARQLGLRLQSLLSGTVPADAFGVLHVDAADDDDVLDPSIIADLHAAIGDDDLLPLLADYRRSIATRMSEVLTAADDRALLRAVHDVAGMVGTIGGIELTQVATGIESNLRSGRRGWAWRGVPALAEAGDRLLAALDERVQGMS